ncbi:S8 family serine peptidase [Pseudarthrobacter cellobiosi]|uniref:S8 family serine peptidase n=1 Tax=Pseudarthrobacter cellobiosi TaxID=2953654 RepID=UPI00208F066A|nr:MULTISPECIES: S8 family serine peptidase [unclassified Pseudarthrobacter]MCO4254445.1 S8 family serine peptidase [Pseudarthrobacter sp. HLT1-5]MCO4274491.1 S8 family serine peptidase [Pseudarthrobacter sp. HLT3-5]
MTRATARFRRAASALLAMTLAGVSLAAGLTLAPAARADAERDKQYWLGESGITKAWEVSKGAGVKIAVIDSGVDAQHPDLKGAVTGGFDASGAGSPNGQKSLGVKPEHGTLVATILAGRGHQPAGATPSPSPGQAAASGPDGMIGVAPEAEILSVSTWLGSANPAGKSDQDQIPEAVRWAVDNGAKVINISLGSATPQWPQSWDAAFLYAEQKDVVIVAAAGNRIGGNLQVGAPATIPGVLTVAGLDRKGTASVDSSSQGISIGVAAPAENLLGGLPGGGYAEWAGTSGAAPIVAGVAALIRSKWPEMSAKQVINRIVSTAKDAGPAGKDPLYGFGVLNAEAALKDSVPEAAANPLGSISDWIRVHRRGNLGAPAPVPTDEVASAVPTLPEPTVPAAEAPSQRDSAVGAAVVIGSVILFVVIIGAAVFQLRRAARNPGAAREEPDTGAFQTVDSGGKT